MILHRIGIIRHTSTPARAQMKKTDLEKLKGLKINSEMKRSPVPGRYSQESAPVLSRKEQRRLEQEQGLVPFACKLNTSLVKRIHDLAQARGAGVNEVVAELLERALGEPG